MSDQAPDAAPPTPSAEPAAQPSQPTAPAAEPSAAAPDDAQREQNRKDFKEWVQAQPIDEDAAVSAIPDRPTPVGMFPMTLAFFALGVWILALSRRRGAPGGLTYVPMIGAGGITLALCMTIYAPLFDRPELFGAGHWLALVTLVVMLLVNLVATAITFFGSSDAPPPGERRRSMVADTSDVDQ